ncbi:MAG: exosortase U, partial [Planctomycetales bacterium]|nr:exosortase U [Planctomycetales bacterium]
AFVAFAILLSLLLHKSFIVALSTVLSVPLWVLVGNFLRLFGIVIVHEVWNRDLSNGLDFLMLEVGSNLLMLLLIWATLRLLTRIFEPLPVADAEFGPIFAGLNKLFCWPQPDPFEDLEPEDEYEKKRFLRRQAEKEAQRRTYPDFIWTSHAVATWSVRVVALLLLVGALVPLRALSSQGLSQLNFGVPRLSAAQVEQLAQEDTLPATLDGGWQRVNFSAERRSPRSQFGEFSLTWRFHSDERQFLASVDLPFLGWHDPVAARALEGWKAEQTTITREDGWPWAEAELENELGGKAYVFYCLFTPDGKPFTHVPPQVGAEGSTGQPGQEAEEEQPAEEQQPQQSTTAVTYQFQLFSESGVELSRAERSGLREKFLQLRDAFRQP